MKNSKKLAYGTGSSIVVQSCQVCNNGKLESILFLGYLPPVNTMPPIGSRPAEQPSYPAQWLYCPKCHLIQLGLVVDPQILFAPDYPYTSSTTKVLRDNFAQLYRECKKMLNLKADDLIVDIGSNDGNLLSNFKNNHRVLGITPEDIGKEATKNGIETYIAFFNNETAKKVLKEKGKAKIIMATNVFAHIENIHEVLSDIISLLTKDGVFISESHYLYDLLKTLQYDTIYHEHLRYYSLHSLKFLLNLHGMEVFHAKKIPSHGGSIRVYAAKPGLYKIEPSVKKLLAKEKSLVTSKKSLLKFAADVTLSKLKLHNLLLNIKKRGNTIYGIGAPSRGSTLVNYAGIDDGILEAIMEIKGSNKIGKYMPGTIIPVLEESLLYKNQPQYVLFLSWHIAKEVAPKLKSKGYKGKFIVPLPSPYILKV